MAEIEQEFNIEDDDNFDVIFEINTSPTKISELDDDVGFATDLNLTNLQKQVDNFQQAEDTEMTNIVAILQNCADNLIDLTEIEI
jgi:hypothetical protein